MGQFKNVARKRGSGSIYLRAGSGGVKTCRAGGKEIATGCTVSVKAGKYVFTDPVSGIVGKEADADGMQAFLKEMDVDLGDMAWGGGIGTNKAGIDTYESLLGSMSEEELKAIQKVDERQLLNQIDYDEIVALGKGVSEGGTPTSLRDLMTPEEIARYDAYWNNVADDMLKSNINSYRQAILNGDITKPTGGKINSKVVTAAIDTNTGDIYYGISGMNNNPTRNAINPQMQAIFR